MGIFEIASSSLNGAQNLAKRVKKVRTMQLRAGSLHSPLDENAVLYESYSGNGMVCHPEAIFRRLLGAEDMNHLKHIWVLKDLSRFRSTVQKFQKNDRVKFVVYGSLAYYKALQTSKYLINNVSFPQQFSKRDGQIYVNTWHGVPLKKMGFDVKGGAVDTRNMIRNFLSADYLLSAGPRMTEQMYIRAFKLVNVYEGSILEVGNPRIDWQFQPAQATIELREWLDKFNMDLDEREVILYAPTWKGSDFTRPSNDAASLAAIVSDLESRIDCEKYRVLVKAHQLVAEEMKSNEALIGRLVPNDIPTNVVLAATSILITDYSSIFYDFIATGNPVIFYTPDIESYRTYRDVYVEPESFPGRLAYSVEELASHVTDTLRDDWGWDQSVRARYDEAVQAFTKHDDGHASG
ncbi:MAG: CDP-glycerol glycerophosphotransferase family protein, partial [Yaniella sp.]|nr:CDP-glycerol glycerophosphotransferase family protein [Yaniella sp.]